MCDIFGHSEAVWTSIKKRNNANFQHASFLQNKLGEKPFCESAWSIIFIFIFCCGCVKPGVLTNGCSRITDPQRLIWTFFLNCEGNTGPFNLRKLQQQNKLLTSVTCCCCELLVLRRFFLKWRFILCLWLLICLIIWAWIRLFIFTT